MKRYHLSKDRHLKLRFSADWRESATGKPSGFYYDIDLDWLRWLDGENYFDNDGWMRSYLYEVEIEASRLLLIHELKTFSSVEIATVSPSLVPVTGTLLIFLDGAN